jgi:hypothetical protein
MEPARQNVSTQSSLLSGASRRNSVFHKCETCKKHPAAGDTLRACGSCFSVRYCSPLCQRTDWSNHRLICENVGIARANALAHHEEQNLPGSAAKSLKRDHAALASWFEVVPGLRDKVQFLGWKHRKESPLIGVSSPSLRVDSVPEVVVSPRTEWDGPWPVAPATRAFYARSDFQQDKTFVVCISIASSNSAGSDTPFSGMSMQRFDSWVYDLSSSALATLTVDDFAAEMVRREKNTSAVLYVRLTGLCSAAHLNGQEGVLRGRAPNDSERFTVCLDSGNVVEVKAQNYELVHRPNLFVGEGGCDATAFHPPLCIK